MTATPTIQRIRTMGQQILPKGSRLWLYGSRARGDYRQDSDWDLIVLVDKESQQLQDFDRYAYRLSNWAGRPERKSTRCFILAKNGRNVISLPSIITLRTTK